MTDNFTPKLPPEERKAVILSAAVQVANTEGLSEVNFQNVAAACMTTTSKRTVASYFKIGDLRRAVVADARANELVKSDAVAMGIA